MNSNPVMFDRDTGSFFSQINATGLTGELRGRTLKEINLYWTTWERGTSGEPPTSSWRSSAEMRCRGRKGASWRSTIGDSYTLYIHPETGRVPAIRYTVSFGRDVEPDEDLPETLFYYDDPVTEDGLTVATAFRGYRYEGPGEIGELLNEAFADSISFRRPFNRDRMAPPEGARFVPPPGG